MSSLQLHEWHAAGEKVCNPDAVTPNEWRDLLTMRTNHARRREFYYIGLKHIITQNKIVIAD